MVDIIRRQLIQGAAAMAAMASLDSFGPPAHAQRSAGKLTDIDHIVVLMKENRSFDHYFGCLKGVRGFDDDAAGRLPDGRSVFEQPDPMNPDGHVLPFRLDTKRTGAQRIHDLSHAWVALHETWNGGKMDGWIPAHRKTDGDSAPLTMGFHTRADLPFYYALADAFTICDGYHCSVMGPTHPNRYYLMTGMIDPEGKFGGPALDNEGLHYGWETYPERLEKAGITWRIYHDRDDYDCNIITKFTQFQGIKGASALKDHALKDRPFYELLWDLRTGNIPQVTWVVPPSDVSEHPDWLPAAGENHTRLVLEALWSNKEYLWSRTAVILNYDENDGFFDHVTPPTPEPGTPGEYVNGLPIGLGFRVPCIVISPFSRGGYVCGDTFDHSSVLRLIEARFGVEVANLSAWRRKTCGDLTHAFGFGEPPRMDIPSLPETERALLMAENNAMALPKPQVPMRQEMPKQETGRRSRRG